MRLDSKSFGFVAKRPGPCGGRETIGAALRGGPEPLGRDQP